MNNGTGRIKKQYIYILLTVLFILLSAFLIRKTAGTSFFKYEVVLSVFIYAVLLWMNEFRKDSLRQIKSKSFFMYFCLSCLMIALNYRAFSNHAAGEPFIRYFSLIQSAVSILPLFFFFCAYSWHIQFKNIFLVSGIILGSFMMLFITPGEVPDEPVHIRETYRVSNIILGINENHYNVMRQDDADASGHDFAKDACLNNDKYNLYLNSISESVKNDNLVECNISDLAGNDYLYFLPALGFSLGRVLNLGTYGVILLGRCFNFIFYLVLTYIAFSLLPGAEELLLTVSLLPMTLQQVISVSYDCPLFALSFLSFSLTLRFAVKKETYTKWDIISGLLVFILVFGIKSHAYFLIGLLPLLTIFSKYMSGKLSSKKKKNIKKGCIAILLILVLGYSLFYLSGGAVNFKYTPNMIDWNGAIERQESYSVGYFIKNPVSVLRLVFNTLYSSTYLYYQQMMGSSLGWLDIKIPDYIIYALSIVLLFSAFKTEKEKLNISRNIRNLILISCILTICFINAGMAIGWTPVSVTMVLGVQGRYFTPFVPFIYVLFKKVGVTLNNRMGNFLLMLIGFVSVCAVECLLLPL